MKNLYTNECVLTNGEHLSIPVMEGTKEVRFFHELEKHFIKSWLDISELPMHVGDEIVI